MAYLINPSGTTIGVSPKSARKGFTLDELYLALFVSDPTRRYVEAFRLADGKWMVVDEEGRLRPRDKRQINHVASALAGRPIEGPALVCEKGELK